jgi:heptosyltransferase II
VTIEGLAHAEAAVASGRGFIYALLHMGNWEVLSHTQLVTAGVRPAAMFQPLRNERLNAHVLRSRERTGCRLFDRHDGFAQPATWLREKNALGILVDQHAGDGGIWCPFFSRLASTTTLPALLAKRTGAQVLTLTVTTTAPGHWRLEIGAPLVLSGKIEPDTALINDALEQCIRQSPHDWFWVHNRWKTPNPDFLLANYRRGVTLPAGMSPSALQPFRMIIRSPNWLGDACMAVPAVRALKRGRPDAQVTIACPEKIADVWRLVPEVNHVIALPHGAGVMSVGRLIRKAGPWDSGILFPNSLRSALEMWRGGVARIVGYTGHHRRWLLHQIIPPRKNPGPILHHTRHYLRIALRLGANVEDPTLHDPVPGAKASPRVPIRIGVCPGAEYGSAKRWPVERFAAAMNEVAAKVPCEWVLFGTGKEAALGEQLQAAVASAPVHNLIGRTTLPELGQALRECAMLVTNDTGTMHLANLLGVPVVAIFGSTEPAATGPRGTHDRVMRRHVECSPCFLRECPLDFRCMTALTPSDVASAILESRLALSADSDQSRLETR